MSGTTGNPLVTQGTLNRLRGSVVIPSFTNLNVTAGYLGTGGISLSLDGDATQMIDTMTGLVTSPEPYIGATITLNLLRTQGFSETWRQQWENSSLIGQVTVHTDTASLPHFDFQNCAITKVPSFGFDGRSADFMVEIRGIYYINNALWNGL